MHPCPIPYLWYSKPIWQEGRERDQPYVVERSMTGLDIFLILVFVGVCVAAAVQGFIRQLMSLGVLFIVTAIVGSVYPYGAMALAAIQEEAPTLADGLAFLIMFLFFAIAMEALLRRGFPTTRLPKLKALDNILGLLVGVINGLIIISLLLTLVGHTARRSWEEIAPRVRRALIRAYRDAALRPYLATFWERYLTTHSIWFRRTPPLLAYLLR
ncbi:MAG TPA: CvpA family protein [Anaerolineales bacterium]|nr:CvpA family protein [Anaerolineales bacterium]